MKYIAISLKNKKQRICSIILGLIFSVFFIFGWEFKYFGTLDYGFLTLVVLLALWAALTVIFYNILNICIKSKKENNFKVKYWIVFWTLMFLSAFLLFAVFPGIFRYDILAQWRIYVTGEYSNHFPPAFCFIFGSIVSIGRHFFGNINCGIALFILLQAMAANLTIAYVITEISNRLKNKKIHYVLLLYFLLHPLLQVLLISTGHDVLFGSLCALLGLELLKISEDQSYLKEKKKCVRIFVLIFSMCALRNNGIYAMLPVLIISIFVINEENRKKFLPIAVGSLLLFQVGYNNIILNRIIVYRETVYHEALSVPVMQISRAVYYDKSVIQKDRLNEYFNPLCNFSSYEYLSDLSDDFKSCLKDDVLQKDILGFIKLWIEIGLNSPRHFFEAPGVLTQGLYYPWVLYSSDHKKDFSQEYTEYGFRKVPTGYDIGGLSDAHPTPNISIVDDFLSNFVGGEQNWSRVPILHIIWSGSFTTYLFIITTAFTLIRKKYSYLLPLSLIFGILFTVSLGPIIIFRYLFPVVLSVPIMVYILIKCISSKR